MLYELVDDTYTKIVTIGTHDHCYNTKVLLWDFNIYTHIQQHIVKYQTKSEEKNNDLSTSDKSVEK